MFDTPSGFAYFQPLQSIRRTRDSLRRRMDGTGNERRHPPLNSAEREQLAIRISAIDGVSLTQARQQIDRFRGISLADAPSSRTTGEIAAVPLHYNPSLGIAMV
jgi:hypothetical protein